MTLLLTLIILTLCLCLMAVGLLLTKKSLRRGCSVNPDECACLPDRQACRREGKSPDECDQPQKN